MSRIALIAGEGRLAPAIAAALDQGCERIIVGCGDSGTSDGGAALWQEGCPAPTPGSSPFESG